MTLTFQFLAILSKLKLVCVRVWRQRCVKLTDRLTSFQSPSVDVMSNLPPWLSGLAISGRGAVKAWLAIRQGVGSYPTPAGMSSEVSA